MPEDKLVAIGEHIASKDSESESDSDDKAVLAMTTVVMMVNWMDQSHLFKRQQEVDKKLVTHDTWIL